jgi:hypothetical protein
MVDLPISGILAVTLALAPGVPIVLIVRALLHGHDPKMLHDREQPTVADLAFQAGATTTVTGALTFVLATAAWNSRLFCNDAKLTDCLDSNPWIVIAAMIVAAILVGFALFRLLRWQAVKLREKTMASESLRKTEDEVAEAKEREQRIQDAKRMYQGQRVVLELRDKRRFQGVLKFDEKDGSKPEMLVLEEPSELPTEARLVPVLIEAREMWLLKSDVLAILHTPTSDGIGITTGSQ